MGSFVLPRLICSYENIPSYGSWWFPSTHSGIPVPSRLHDGGGWRWGAVNLGLETGIGQQKGPGTPLPYPPHSPCSCSRGSCVDDLIPQICFVPEKMESV